MRYTETPILLKQGILRRSIRCALAVLAVAATLSAPPAAADELADSVNAIEFANSLGLNVVGLTADQRLVKFRVAVPQVLQTAGAVSGLNLVDTALVGIDYRVQDGKLYGVGNGGGVYTIDTNTAKATLVSQLTVPLDGASFGVDFNPAADRLRIVSDTGQNLAHNVNPGGTTAANTTLNYPAPANINPATGVTGAAYTNNDLDPNTGTTLFDIDTVRNQLAIQSPPGQGALVANGSLTVDPVTPVGFDIYSSVQNGVSVRSSGFASLVVNGKSGLYRVNLLTGKASLIGNFNDTVVDIAIPLNQ